MVALGGGRFLMSEVPLYIRPAPRTLLWSWRGRRLRMSKTPRYRGYSNLRTRNAPQVVLCSQAQTYRRTPGWCVSLIPSNPWKAHTQDPAMVLRGAAAPYEGGSPVAWDRPAWGATGALESRRPAYLRRLAYSRRPACSRRLA